MPSPAVGDYTVASISLGISPTHLRSAQLDMYDEDVLVCIS